jgi:hypothetical protein
LASKPQVSAKDVLADIRAGLTDPQLSKKYGLSAKGLQSLITKLIKMGLIKHAELSQRPRGAGLPVEQPTSPGRFTCPACGLHQEKHFSECPRCGVIPVKYGQPPMPREMPDAEPRETPTRGRQASISPSGSGLPTHSTFVPDLVMIENEYLLWEYEADMYYTSSNIFAKMINKILQSLAYLIGFRMKGHIIATNRRIIYESRSYFLWIFHYAESVDTMLVNKIGGITSAHEASLLVFFKSKVVHVYSSGRAGTRFVFKKIDEEELHERIAELTQIAVQT